MIKAFAYGLIFALGLIIPLGPQNMFILGQGMSNPNRRQVMAVALTAALSDTLLIAVAISGLTLVVFHFAWLRDVLLIVGIIFLAYLGWKAWRSPTSDIKQAQKQQSRQLLKLISLTLALSLLNPYALLDTVVTIGSVSLSFHGTDRLAFAVACVLASWIWFFNLAFAGKLIARVRIIQTYRGQISATIMWLAAIYLLLKLFNVPI